jgi:hypothetical protein
MSDRNSKLQPHVVFIWKVMCPAKNSVPMERGKKDIRGFNHKDIK